MPEKPVISNTSPLVGLWALNLFPLLRELYTEVLIPEEVRDEFFAIEREVREAALKNAPWIRTVPFKCLRRYTFEFQRKKALCVFGS